MNDTDGKLYWHKYFQMMPELRAATDRAESVFWTPAQITWNKDAEHFKYLHTNEQHLIKSILAIFATADGIVNMNLLTRFLPCMTCSEARTFYLYQVHMEDVHARTYNDALSNYIPDVNERNLLLNAITQIDVIADIGDICQTYTNDAAIPFNVLNFMYAIVEGVIFSASFCIISYYKKRNNSLEGLCQSNDFIQRDENMHRDFACMVNRTLEVPLDEITAKDIMLAVIPKLEAFIRYILPHPVGELSSVSMIQHVQSIADLLMRDFGFKPIYNSVSSFTWFTTQQLVSQTAFFERKTASYPTNVKQSADIFVGDF
jgi:ribonucleotide reductase beta subunit family protein with ferritin-like domain